MLGFQEIKRKWVPSGGGMTKNCFCNKKLLIIFVGNCSDHSKIIFIGDIFWDAVSCAECVGAFFGGFFEHCPASLDDLVGFAAADEVEVDASQ